MYNKLNIGSGSVNLEGYVNLDIDPRTNPDVVADARDLPFEDNTFDTVRSYGFIEHIEPDDIDKVLSEMYRVLKDDGEIQIGTEDFEHQVNLYLKKGINPWTLSAVYGPHYSHRMLFDFKYLYPYMERAGFREIRKLDCNQEYKTKYNFSDGVLFVVGVK